MQAATQRHKLELLSKARQLYAQRYAQSAAALRKSNATLDVTETDLTALLDADSRVNQAAQDLNKTQHDLNSLLSLAPELEVPLLAPSEALAAETPAAIADALQRLPQRRADLLALQASYRSQEAQLQRAVLAQFPSLNISLTRARDTANVHTVSVSVTIDLPFLNANRARSQCSERR